MFFTNGPKTACIWICWYALKHQGRRAIGQWTVNDIAVACDPTHIGSAPKYIAVMIIEGVLMGHRGINEVAASGVHHALRRASGPGSVKDKQWIFRIHRLRCAFSRSLCHGGGVAVIASFFGRKVSAGALDHQSCDVARDFQRHVYICLQRCGFATAWGLVCSHDQFGATGGEARGQCFGRESTKDDRMDSTDTIAGQHGIGSFWDHRHIKNNPVALGHAQRLVDIRQFANLCVQLIIGDMRTLIGIVAFPDDRSLIATGG